MSLEKHLKVKLAKLNEPLTVGLSTRPLSSFPYPYKRGPKLLPIVRKVVPINFSNRCIIIISTIFKLFMLKESLNTHMLGCFFLMCGYYRTK